MQERIISYTTVLITLEENKSCVMMMVKRLQPESVPGSFTYKLHVKNKSQVNLAVLLKKKKKKKVHKNLATYKETGQNLVI